MISKEKLPTYDINRVLNDVNLNIEGIFSQIFGDIKERGSNFLKYSGGISVTTKGRFAGCYKNFKTGSSGNIIDLIKEECGLNFADSIKYIIENYLHAPVDMYYENSAHHNSSSFEKTNQNQEKSLDELKKEAKLLTVRSMYKSSVAPKNSVVNRYLQKRGINDISHMNIRYLGSKFEYYHYSVADDKLEIKKEKKNSKFPIMLVFSENENGEICGVQRTFLDYKTDYKKEIGDLKRSKFSLGTVKNGVILQKGNSNRIYVGEGVETCASVGCFDKDATVIATLSFSNFKNILHHIKSIQGYKLILLKDNDLIDDDSEFFNILSFYKENNVSGIYKEPSAIDNKKTDWNNFLMKKGSQALKEEFLL